MPRDDGAGIPHPAGSRLVVHRRAGFALAAPHVVMRGGLPIIRLERAIIDSWPLLVADNQRQAALEAVNRRLTTGARLLDALRLAGRTEGCVQMRELFSLLEIGCRSELELWGHARVFDDRALGDVVLQQRVRTAVGSFVLDRAHLDALVGVELDGAAWHESAEQRERDVRRDAALAAEGWLVVRFTHARLRREPLECRRELAAILAVRRSLRQA
jgi:very-short-patch-repair endonuclease